MANYYSQYTGAEIDDILDKAIELPVIQQGSDNNKILGVNNTGTGVEWKNLAAIPAPSGSMDTFMYLGFDSQSNIYSWNTIAELAGQLSEYFEPINQGDSV